MIDQVLQRERVGRIEIQQQLTSVDRARFVFEFVARHQRMPIRRGDLLFFGGSGGRLLDQHVGQLAPLAELVVNESGQRERALMVGIELHRLTNEVRYAVERVVAGIAVAVGELRSAQKHLHAHLVVLVVERFDQGLLDRHVEVGAAKLDLSERLVDLRLVGFELARALICVLRLIVAQQLFVQDASKLELFGAGDVRLIVELDFELEKTCHDRPVA